MWDLQTDMKIANWYENCKLIWELQSYYRSRGSGATWCPGIFKKIYFFSGGGELSGDVGGSDWSLMQQTIGRLEYFSFRSVTTTTIITNSHRRRRSPSLPMDCNQIKTQRHQNYHLKRISIDFLPRFCLQIVVISIHNHQFWPFVSIKTSPPLLKLPTAIRDPSPPIACEFQSNKNTETSNITT